jgi:hypothetical protein
MNKGRILRVKYGYNPNSSSVGSATSGLMAESLQNAINKSTNSSVLADLLGINLSKSANATTTTTLSQSTAGGSWLMGGGILDTLIYVVSAAITSVIIYFTAKKIARTIRRKMKK